MSQENSEIIGKESIAPSLLEPEYPGLILPVGSIASVDSIDSKNLIFQEYFIDSKDLIFPEDSIDSEDFIVPEDSIDSKDFIFQEDFIGSKDLIFQEDSITPQEIDIDPLTGMAARSFWPPNWFNSMMNGTNNGSQVTVLKDTRLNIHMDSIWYQNLMRVTATVKVEWLSGTYGDIFT